MKNIQKIYIQNWNYILFNSKKCKFFGPLDISDRLLYLRNGNPIKALIFLGMFLVFNIICYVVILARIIHVSHVFWGLCPSTQASWSRTCSEAESIQLFRDLEMALDEPSLSTPSNLG